MIPYLPCIHFVFASPKFHPELVIDQRKVDSDKKNLNPLNKKTIYQQWSTTYTKSKPKKQFNCTDNINIKIKFRFST